MGLEVNKVKYKPEWSLVRLKEVCNRISDGTHFTPTYLNDGIPFISVKDIYDDKVHFNKCKYISKEVHEELIKRCNPEKDDILITKSGTIGRMALVPEKPEFSLFVSVALIKNRKEIIGSKFLKLCLENFLNSINISQDIKGGLLKNFHLEDIRETLVPTVDLKEQQAIVSKTEELFSELDKGIEQLKTAQQQLKTYRQSVLKWAFEGKLTEEWREQHSHLQSGNECVKQIQNEKEKIAKANGKKIKPMTSITDDEMEELFEIPARWAWVRNEDYLFEVKDGTHDTPKYQDEGIPFITQKNIREEGLDFSNVQFISEQDHTKFYQRSNVAKNDIIISMIGHNRGMTAIVDTDKVFSIKNVGLFKFLPSFQSYKFSFYYYQSKVGLNMVLKKSKGGAQPFIGLTELRNWAVVVCSLEEQNQIVQEIESRLSVADKMEENITQSLQQAEALRQSILKKAFEGRLV